MNPDIGANIASAVAKSGAAVLVVWMTSVSGCGGLVDDPRGRDTFVCPSGSECGPRTCAPDETCQSTACGCCAPQGTDCLIGSCGPVASMVCQGTQCAGYTTGPAGTAIGACCLQASGSPCGLALPSGECVDVGQYPPLVTDCGTYSACLAERGGCSVANDCVCGRCRCDWEALRTCASPGFCKVAKAAFDSCLATEHCVSP